MAEAKKCDRCENFYLVSHVKNTNYSIGGTPLERLDIGNMNMKDYSRIDLCPACLKSFINWFDEGGLK